MATMPPGAHTRSISARPASPPCSDSTVNAEHATTRPADAFGTGSSSKNPSSTRTLSSDSSRIRARSRSRSGPAGSTATTCPVRRARSTVNRPEPAPASTARSTEGIQSRIDRWMCSPATSRSYRSGSSRYRSSQASSGPTRGHSRIASSGTGDAERPQEAVALAWREDLEVSRPVSPHQALGRRGPSGPDGTGRLVHGSRRRVAQFFSVSRSTTSHRRPGGRRRSSRSQIASASTSVVGMHPSSQGTSMFRFRWSTSSRTSSPDHRPTARRGRTGSRSPRRAPRAA